LDYSGKCVHTRMSTSQAELAVTDVGPKNSSKWDLQP